MDALLMCGGEGSRLGGREKPLRPVGGRRMVDRVLAALRASAVGDVYAVTSPNAPETATVVDAPRIETDGAGYVADLQDALSDDRLSQPVLTVAADLPLLSAADVDDVLSAHECGPLTVVVPAGRVLGLGCSIESPKRHEGRQTRPAGVNVVAPGTETAITRRRRGLAVNVNRPRDLAVARWLAADKT